jgi:effector-binding domain-containing protein
MVLKVLADTSNWAQWFAESGYMVTAEPGSTDGVHLLAMHPQRGNERWNFTVREDTLNFLVWNIRPDPSSSGFKQNFMRRWNNLSGNTDESMYMTILGKIGARAAAMPVTETVLGFEATIQTEPTIQVLSIRDQVSNEEIGNKLSQNFASLASFMSENAIAESGRPLVIWHSFTADRSEIETCIPVSAAIEGKGKIGMRVLEETRALVIRYVGPYSNLAPVYAAATDYLQGKGFAGNGPPREIYVIDPSTEPDSALWVTEIVFPVIGVDY